MAVPQSPDCSVNQLQPGLRLLTCKLKIQIPGRGSGWCKQSCALPLACGWLGFPDGQSHGDGFQRPVVVSPGEAWQW